MSFTILKGLTLTAGSRSVGVEVACWQGDCKVVLPDLVKNRGFCPWSTVQGRIFSTYQGHEKLDADLSDQDPESLAGGASKVAFRCENAVALWETLFPKVCG